MECDVENESRSDQDQHGELAAGARNAPTTSAPVSSVVQLKTRPSLRRRILVRLMFVAFSLVLSVALVEIVGRLIFRAVADDARFYPRLEANVIRSMAILESTRTPGTFDAKFGTVLSPNATVRTPAFGRTITEQTNSLGFRTREIEPRLPGELRVMLVGDSYFYGVFMNADETIGALLEEMSQSDPQVKRPLRVYNFAIYGYCSTQELVVAQTYAPRIQPDIVILGFFAANDLIPNALTQIDNEGRFVPVAERIERFRHDLRAELGPWRHSLIARIVYQTSPATTRTVYRLGRQPWVLEQNFQVLRQFQNFCRQQKYRFGVVFQHTTDSLSSGWRAALYPTDDVQRRLTAYCEESGIPFADMRVEFKKGGDWQKFIIKQDGHCSVLGVRKTAEVIYRQFIRHELVGPSGPGPDAPAPSAETAVKPG
jgi:hypothetical protein